MFNNDLISITIKIMELILRKYENNEITEEQFIENTRIKLDYLMKAKDSENVSENNKSAITLILSKYNSITGQHSIDCLIENKNV